MLRWRLLLGALFIAALAGLLWLDFHAASPGAWLLGLALLVGLAAAQEMLSLLAAGGYYPQPLVVYGGTLLVIASNLAWLVWRVVPDDQPLARLAWPAMTLAVLLLAALIGEMVRYRKPGNAIVHAALAFFSVAYVGLLLTFAMQLRMLHGPIDGMVALIALVVVVKMCDTGAYAVGRLIGRHKMSPSISPGKTWEGAAGGIAFATLGSWLAFHCIPPAIQHTLTGHPLAWLWFGLVVGVAGMLGDLAESLLKRDMGRKDSSTWLPGFGGVLDLLDSILLAAPVAYLCWWLAGK